MRTGPQQRAFNAGRFFVERALILPIQAFVRTETLSGLTLLLATGAALAWANSPWDARYFDLLARELSLDTSFFALHLNVHDVINEGLMTLFFFVVGLEIKRELLRGELSSTRKAALPVAAALGGMVVPALIYTAWNGGAPGSKGWGIPMATDIAFALGVLSLLSSRAPFALRVFLLALAIVDDLGAIIVIAVFYTDHLSLEATAWAIVVVGAILAARRAGVRSMSLYVVLGFLLWVAVLKAGLHATLAGVVLAALTPAGPYFDREAFGETTTRLLARFRKAEADGDAEVAAASLREFERLARESEAPLDRLEQQLHAWASYAVVPLFAFANAGIGLSPGVIADSAGSRVTLGVVLGLILGKPAGILLFTWLAVRLRLGALPQNVSFVHILGGGLVAGIGFTVSLFVTGLAFENADLINDAKLGILAASLLAGITGFVYLWVAPGEPEPSAAASRPGEGEPA